MPHFQGSRGTIAAYFSPWCFTNQYKNTTQFCFYAGLAATQNTNLLSGIQCAVVNCSTDTPALYPWNTNDYINSINWLVISSSDANSYAVYSISGDKKIICAEEYPGESNTPKLYLSDGKIYVSLKNHKAKYDVLLVRFGKYLPKNG